MNDIFELNDQIRIDSCRNLFQILWKFELILTFDA